MNTDEICELLKKQFSDMEVAKNESMKKHTSFRIGGEAEIFIKAKSIEEVKFILKLCIERNIPLNIIGNGSNVLVKDEGVKGIVLEICLDNISIENLENNEVIVTAQSGVLLVVLAQKLLKDSIAGFEFASGIPGTIGGAVRMNAGAYGTEFKDIVIETTALNKDGEIVKFSNEEQNFEYRNSLFKNKEYIIIETKLKLTKVEDSTQIKTKMDEYKESRIEKQPIEFPNAGSTFKRGKDFITAKLIDECGLKGYQIGGAQVSTKHAGFVVNTGNATAKDVLELIQYVKKTVYEKCGKEIEMEIEVI